MATDGSEDGDLTAAERRRLGDIRAAESLADLRDRLGAASLHDAYFDAKATWRDLRERELDAGDGEDGDRSDGPIPGSSVVVDGHEFHVHGITHADTEAERAFVREGVREYLDAGATVYCEQGIRPMYFADLGGVCAMDDYRWAMDRCRELGLDSHVERFPAAEYNSVVEDVSGLAAEFQDAAFSLIDAGSDLYGERFRDALGAVAASFFRDHGDFATGDDFESFKRHHAAARDPAAGLVSLQRYYELAFLPQPLEREWLRRHDPELELVTHARNERMADYAVYHNDTAEAVHLIVGAAHGPGVRYYLDEHRDGRRSVESFTLA